MISKLAHLAKYKTETERTRAFLALSGLLVDFSARLRVLMIGLRCDFLCGYPSRFSRFRVFDVSKTAPSGVDLAAWLRSR